MMNKIFFSYSWKDLPIAVRIYADLVRNGLSIWRDEFSAETGKRYADAGSGVEVLCTKAGQGDLAFAGRPLERKDAKPLPASD